MIRKEQDGIQWLEFELFASHKKLVHGVFLRHGGYSKEPYGSLNISVQGGDDSDAVKKNRHALADCLKCPRFILPILKHGKKVAELTAADCKRPAADGLMTTRSDLGLLITHADCQAAIFYDPVQNVLANVHAGWRGNVQNIYAETIHLMKKKHGSKPENLLVAISPSLCPKSSEFIHFRTEFPKCFWQFQEKQYHFNLWEISRWQLEEVGVLSHHIEIAEISTYHNPEDFYSYRRDSITGRHGTLAYLKSFA